MKTKLLLSITLLVCSKLYSQTPPLPNTPWSLTGNIGIGTTNPQNRLEIQTDMPSEGLTIKQINIGAAGLKFENLTSNISWGLFGLGFGDAAGSGNFALYNLTASQCRFLINGGTGNVGIGTTTPLDNRLAINAAVGDNGIECRVGSNSNLIYRGINMSNGIETFQVWGNGNTVIHCTQASPTDHAFVVVDAFGPPNTWVKNFIVRRNGTVHAREIFVNLSSWPDYVFKTQYNLMPLEELDRFIKINHHLPNVPSAKEVEEEGLGLGDLSKIQMEKIEELTLYILELNKEIENLKSLIGKKGR